MTCYGVTAPTLPVANVHPGRSTSSQLGFCSQPGNWPGNLQGFALFAACKGSSQPLDRHDVHLGFLGTTEGLIARPTSFDGCSFLFAYPNRGGSTEICSDSALHSTCRVPPAIDRGWKEHDRVGVLLHDRGRSKRLRAHLGQDDVETPLPRVRELHLARSDPIPSGGYPGRQARLCLGARPTTSTASSHPSPQPHNSDWLG